MVKYFRTQPASNDVCIEPSLQPLSGETLNSASSSVQDGARLDIAANGFWGDGLRELILMFVSLTPWLPLTANTISPPATRNKKI